LEHVQLVFINELVQELALADGFRVVKTFLHGKLHHLFPDYVDVAGQIRSFLVWFTVVFWHTNVPFRKYGGKQLSKNFHGAGQSDPFWRMFADWKEAILRIGREEFRHDRDG